MFCNMITRVNSLANLRTEWGVGGRRAQPDDAVQPVLAVHRLLFNDCVQLVLERLVGHAEQSHELDRILLHVQWLDDQLRRSDVMRAQRPNPVPPVSCIDTGRTR